MRAFLQKKAGATYFGDSNITVNIRKHNMEFIFALSGGWHTVISLTQTEKGVMLLAGVGKMSESLDKIMPTLRLKPGEHETFIDILGGKSEYQLLNVDFDGKGLETGIGKLIESNPRPHLQILGDAAIQKEAERLHRAMLDLYHDLRKSPYPALKALTDHFYD